MKLNITEVIDECLKGGIQDRKSDTSKAGEPVKVKTLNLKVRGQSITFSCVILGKTKEEYARLDFEFDNVLNPFYYLEVLRLSLKVDWSGIYMSQREKKLLIFRKEYGETNKEYLNRSLRYLYMIKKCLFIK